MASMALDHPLRPSCPLGLRWPHVIASRLRLLRRARTRRRTLALVLTESRNPRAIEDIGLRPPGRDALDLWARAILLHRP